jgi:hypothetical protein
MFLYAKTLPEAKNNATNTQAPNNANSGNSAPVNPLANNVIAAMFGANNVNPQIRQPPPVTLPPTGQSSYIVPNINPQRPNISFKYK